LQWSCKDRLIDIHWGCSEHPSCPRSFREGCGLISSIEIEEVDSASGAMIKGSLRHNANPTWWKRLPMPRKYVLVVVPCAHVRSTHRKGWNNFAEVECCSCGRSEVHVFRVASRTHPNPTIWKRQVLSIGSCDSLVEWELQVLCLCIVQLRLLPLPIAGWCICRACKPWHCAKCRQRHRRSFMPASRG